MSVSDKTVNNHETNDSLLGSYRVLDLTDDKGLLCGKSLVTGQANWQNYDKDIKVRHRIRGN